MSASASPYELLDQARLLCREHGAPTAGLWPRAAALLARQALEAALDAYWVAGPYPILTSCPMQSQLICLAQVVGRDWAGNLAVTWASLRLSGACHAHPYELAPTVGELLGWIEDTERFCSPWPTV